MMSAVEQVERAIEAVRITTPTSFTWLGAASPRLTPAMRATLSPALARRCLHFLLRQQLYQDFYIRGEVTPAPRLAAHQGGAALTTPFIEALSAANAGQGSWQDGWTVRSVVPAGIVASNGALTLLAQPGEYRPANDASPGGRVSVRFPKEARRISPGFYMAEGDSVPGAGDEIVRLYWHLQPDSAVVLMRELTTRLNAAGVPFRFKVLHNPDAYVRCDAGVLYLRQADYPAAAPILARVYPLVAASLASPTPVFTRTLAPGLGLAEDPGGGESFGQHRCGLLAEGLIRADEEGQQTVADRLAVIRQVFAGAGVDLDRPHLRPDAVDAYEFQPTPGQEPSVPDVTARCSPMPEVSLLDVAHDIGHRLAQEAIWHGDRCTWMTSDIRPQAATARMVVTMHPLGPDLYSGASGVALFLAELAAQTGDLLMRETALGAIRQTLATLQTLEPAARLGLYSGWMGIAWSAVRIGTVLDDPALVDAGGDLLERCLREAWDGRSVDLLAGLAGAVVGALALQRMNDSGRLLDWARAAGDILLGVAESSSAGLAWRATYQPAQPGLTGFSHGAAGIGHALCELFAATGDERFLTGARRAFDYERRWFDPSLGNWVDLRGLPRRTKPGTSGLPTMVAWCHGAPGIALSRLRAWELTGDATARAEAVVALRTTRNAVALALGEGEGDVTLCHGLLGNAEVVLQGSRILDEPAWASLAREAARRTIARYGANDRPWPCGAHTGEVPGLMLGLAGIGHFFLRLHDEAVPSVLLLRTDEVSAWTSPPDEPTGTDRGTRQPALATA